MKILTFGQEYNFINTNVSDDEDLNEEEKSLKGKKGNLLIMNNKNNSSNFNFPNEGKILKKAKTKKTFEEPKNKIDSEREKIINLLNNIDLKPRGKFKFADFEGFVNKFL